MRSLASNWKDGQSAFHPLIGYQLTECGQKFLKTIDAIKELPADIAGSLQPAQDKSQTN